LIEDNTTSQKKENPEILKMNKQEIQVKDLKFRQDRKGWCKDEVKTRPGTEKLAGKMTPVAKM
jgi:hypothetical protein